MSDMVISRPKNKLEARLKRIQAGDRSDAAKWGRLLLFAIVAVWLAGFFVGFVTSVTILVIIGFAAAILGWRSPSLAVMGIGILVALDAPTRVYLLTGGLLRWNTLNYWMIIVILLSLPFMLRVTDPHTRLIQVFLLVISLEALIAPSLTQALQAILSVVFVLGLYVYLARVLNDDKAFFWLGIIVGTLAALGGLVFYLQRNSLPSINPNADATFPLVALFVLTAVFPFARSQPRSRIFFFLLATVNFLWIFLTGSRGNMLVGVCCLVGLILLNRSLSWNILLVTLGLLVGIYISYRFVEEQLYARTRVERLLDPTYTLAERTSGRSDIAATGWRIFLDHPLGIGTGGFSQVYLQYDTSWNNEREAHSAWVKVLAENGVPGFLLLGLYVGSFVLVGIKKRDKDLGLIGALTTLAFITNFATTEYQNKGLWLLAACATVMLHREEFLQNVKIGGKLKKGQRWALRHLKHRKVENPIKEPRNG